MNIENYLSNFFKGTKNPSLNAMQFFMEEFVHPENELKFIHVAGTNGKGSCVEIITNILIKAGYKVGKFISPHLIKYNERISVNNENISDTEMENLINIINPKIEKYNSKNNINVTLFELETTMAFLYFKNKKCDFVVLETGLGGIYDCTNIIKNPLVSIITSIGYDHMHILGNTLPEIAHQKAGIIKENSETVIYNQNAEIDNVFVEECKRKNNLLHVINDKDISNYYFDDDFQYFDYKDMKNLSINLKGKIQIKNASLCIETIKILNKLGYKINLKSIQDGLNTVIHKGRMEKLNKNPLIIFDGAHNEPAIKNLQSAINMYYKDMDKVYVISILKTKDYIKMLNILSEDKKAVFILTSGNDAEKYVSKEELYNYMKNSLNAKNIFKMELTQAIHEIKKNSDKANFIVGSFYVYGTAVDEINKNK